MAPELNALRKSINKLMIIFIIGSCCYVVVALAAIWLGYYVMRYQLENEFRYGVCFLVIAAWLMLWQMCQSLNFKASVPKSYTQITAEQYPELFNIINEVTGSLHMPSVDKVYLSPDAMAAVFILPQFRNILFKADRRLVIGMGFLTQMDDDELRAVLYHEFGHYAQKEMKNLLSVYTLGQFSRSFVAQVEKSQADAQIKKLINFFTLFVLAMCRRINAKYTRMAKYMEYAADDVALQYVGRATLQRALLHAACIQYNYGMIKWGKHQLCTGSDMVLDDEYRALTLICRYSHPPRRLLKAELLKRVERLGSFCDDKNAALTLVRDAVSYEPAELEPGMQYCTAYRFAQWMREGGNIYTRRKMREKSVKLNVLMPPKKHKWPRGDSYYTLLIDNKRVGEGNFVKGFSLKKRISPGRHVLTAQSRSAVTCIPFEFEVKENHTYRIEVDYTYSFFKSKRYEVFVETFECVDAPL